MVVGTAEGFDDEFVEGLLDVEEIMGDIELLTDKGGLGSATGAGVVALLGEGDFHGDPKDVPAGVLEEHGGDGAIDAAAHEHGNLLGRVTGTEGLKSWR